MLRTATISPCGKFRYSLRRTWGEGNIVSFVMLNPSTADAEKDDPTIRRCIDFARRWNFGALEVVNLFAFRATNPRLLIDAPDAIGPDNNLAISKAAERAASIVVAWGRLSKWGLSRRTEVCSLLECFPLLCLGETQGHHPRHPLYVPKSMPMVLYRGALC